MRRRGFSFIETVVALGLVAAVLMVAVQLIPSALLLLRGVERQQAACELAQRILEEQSVRPWAELVMGGTENRTETQENLVYSVRVEVRAVPDAPPELARVLHVQVTWEYRDRRHTVIRELLVHHLRAG